jgi:fucose permease
MASNEQLFHNEQPIRPRFHRFPVALYAAAVCSGMGTVLTGALLPALTRMQHLNDRQAGLLLGVQFLGGFLGAVTVLSPAWRSLRAGLPVAGVALLLMAAALGHRAGVLFGCVLLFGIGLGQMTTAVNLIVGTERAVNRAGHLSFLNLLWSLGAAISPVAASLALRRLSVAELFAVFGAALLMLSVMVLVAPATLPPTIDFMQASGAPVPFNMGWGVFAVLGLLFLLYGGTENSMSGWVSSYAQRFTRASAAEAPLITAAFWVGLDVGRAAATLFLRLVPELRALRVAALSFAVCAVALAQTQVAWHTAVLAAACGLSLAPIFPAALSRATELRIPPRRIGFILSFCGLGASTLPFLVGVVSYRVGSLRVGLLLPVAYAVGMLLVLSWPGSPLLATRGLAPKNER